MVLFKSDPPSYADEQLESQLSALSSIPVNTLSTASQHEKPSSVLETALSDLSASKPPSRDKLEVILQTLVQDRKGVSVQSQVDKAVEQEIVGRAVTILWKETFNELLQSAIELEGEKQWWDAVLNSRRGIPIYLAQTLPSRVYKALPPASTLTLHSFTQLETASLFNKTPSLALSAITSPFILARREVITSRRTLTAARDEAAERIGRLSAHGPKWGAESFDEVSNEADRLFSVVASALGGQAGTATPESLLTVLTKDLAHSRALIDKIVLQHGRPGPLTRLWLPFLFLPPALYALASAIVRNKEWMKQQVLDAKETIRGFFIQWVWEPLEDIGKTMRGGGEGLGVSAGTVKSDQESLERMVTDLGRDYYKMDAQQLAALDERVRHGNMTDVLKAYEKEIQNPLRSALMGSLVRTLLIQVQKTKTDLSLSLLSLDHLVKSQQLTFAFVGVAPSFLILYGVSGWFRRLYTGENRGKTRKTAYYNGIRDIERLVLASPKKGEEMPDKDKGLLIVSVSSMRIWAAGLGVANREGFLDDLRLVEKPELSRSDKLRVVDRIWRSWSADGRRRL